MPGLEKSTVKLTKNILKYNRKLQKMYHTWRHEEQGKITTGQIKQSQANEASLENRLANENCL